jgi:predicted transcriptional regulator
MIPNISSEVQQVEQTFNQAGFNTISCEEPYYSSSFNVIAIKPNHFIITKVAQNIDNIPDEDLLDMTVIARFLSGIPLLVAKNNRRTDLENDAIYFRFDNQVVALSYETLKRLLIENILP